MEVNYPSDLSDVQWQLIRPLLPAVADVGRKPIDRRLILNAILYLVRTGCQWRQLPANFPNWKTVYTVFRRWRLAGVWEQVHAALRSRCRKLAGKRSQPTVCIIDSQSTRTAEGGELRGYDAAKKVTGRKRHLLVDTLGMVWQVIVHPGDWSDQLGAHFPLSHLSQVCKRVKKIYADSAYARDGLPAWVKAQFGWNLEIVSRPKQTQGFIALPKRWIIERTFAWLVRYRRLAKDYERQVEHSETFILIAMINLMSRRIAMKY